jgi:hypothetical protein
MKKAVLGAVVALLLFPLLVVALVAAAFAVAKAAEAGPSQAALADIPAEYLALYQQAAKTCPGMSWALVAAIGKVETNHGRSELPGVASGANSAGAMGPMQFMPGTWAALGIDANADGLRNVYDPPDAVYGAVRYLCANGGGDPARLRNAIWNYNHAGWYVEKVLAQMQAYLAAGTLGASPASVDELLRNPNLVLSANARTDLLAGIVDQRVVATLGAMAANHEVAVSVIKTGHNKFVNGTAGISNHWYARAADVYRIDGAAVSRANANAKALTQSLLAAGPPLRPDELGSPFAELSGLPGAFTDADHQDHLHLGWDA